MVAILTVLTRRVCVLTLRICLGYFVEQAIHEYVMLEWGQEQDVTLDTKLAELGASNEVQCSLACSPNSTVLT